MTARPLFLSAFLSLLPLAVGCGGGAQDACIGDTCARVDQAGGAGGGAAQGFRGDGSRTPSWGGWAWGDVPADAVAHAGFDWFETGYPGDGQVWVNETLRAAGVRPFAYINLGELHGDLAGAAAYSGPILRTNGDWGTYLVDVTDGSWQDWLVRRADEAYRTGSRGVKWDVAMPDVPPGKTRGDVNEAIAATMRRIRAQHPDMKFVFNAGFDFALAHPELVDGVQTEGLFTAGSYPGAYLQPWVDPYWWGPQFEQAKKLRGMGIPIFDAEYADPWGTQAHELFAAVTSQGFVPYITSDHWNIRGWGLNVNPGW